MTERGQLTRTQVQRLLAAIDPNHVEQKQGLSYIAQHQARAEMIRIFGPGNWDSDVTDMELIYEYEKPGTGNNANKTYYVTCYRAKVVVNIRDYWGRPVATFGEWHAEENAPQPNRGEAHALAMTSVESYALRRALIGLGDRLGLGLYDKGSHAPLVRGSLVLTDPESPLYAEQKKGDSTEPAQKPGAAYQDKFNQGAPVSAT